MPPTLYSMAIGALLGVALLGAAFDRRSLVIVVVAAALPDLDAVVSLVLEGATNAVFHTALVPGLVFLVLLWDTMFADHSRLIDRFGWWGARTAWVALAAYVVAGIVPDLASESGVNLLYPLVDQFYALDGVFYYSTTDGIVQTYLGPGENGRLLEITRLGSTAEHHVPTWINPTAGAGIDTGVERRVTLLESGFQAVVVAAAIAALGVRAWGDR